MCVCVCVCVYTKMWLSKKNKIFMVRTVDVIDL